MMEKKVDCPCKRLKCERYGDCDACRKHHSRPDVKHLTACDRMKLKEEKKKEGKTGEGIEYQGSNRS